MRYAHKCPCCGRYVQRGRTYCDVYTPDWLVLAERAARIDARVRELWAGMRK